MAEAQVAAPATPAAPQVADTAKGTEGKQESAKPAEQTAEEFEEVAIGSHKGKVSKKLAEQLKNLERGYQAKYQEIAQMRKEYPQQVMQAFKNNPKEFMSRMGIDPVEFAEATLAEKIEMMGLSPEQLELRELKKYREETEKEKAERQKKEQEEKESAEYNQHYEKFQKDFVESWKKTGLTADPYFGQLMAATMLSYSKQGKDLTPDEAAVIVKDRWTEQARGILSTLDVEQLKSILGDELLKKVREYEIAKVTGKAPGAPKSKEPAKTAVTQKKPMNELEWREQMKNLADNV